MPSIVSAAQAHDQTPQIGWRIPLIALTAYTALFITGYLIDMPILNQIGFLAFVYIFIIGNYDRMFSLERDRTVTLALCMIAYLAFHLILFYGTLNPNPFSKTAMIFVLYTMFFSQKYSPLSECSERYMFIALTGIIIIGSLFVDREAISREHGRLAGLFVNPNSFALSVFMLLFFLDEDRDPPSRRLAMHITVLACIGLSATTGAILAYLSGMAFKLRASIWKYLRYRYVPHILLAVAVAIVSLTVFDIVGRHTSTFKRISYQLVIIFDNIEGTLEGRQLNFYYFDSKYGMTVSSGIWRLTNWIKIIRYYLNSDAVEMLIGHGAGSTRITIGSLPHNDYIRILYDYGAAGLGIFIVFFVSVYRRIKPAYKYIVIIVAVYCITENNLDNMLFMSMFVAFMATVQSGRGMSISTLQPSLQGEIAAPVRHFVP